MVVSTAVKPDNPEVGAARSRRIPVVPRALMLAELMRLRQGIAIAGTHGKTTTTSLIASVLAEAGMDPTFVIGGRLEAAGSHAKLGSGEFIVVEADESDASFLHLQPVLAVVTNIDADHMETYGHDFSRLRQAFLDFLQRLPFYGMAVLCVDDANVRAIMPLVTKPITTYGLSEQAQIRAVEYPPRGRAHALHGRSASQRRAGQVAGGRAESAGRAQRAERAGRHRGRAGGAGARRRPSLRALAEFEGVGRRFERYGEMALPGGGSFALIDDYGHHPAEMEATLAAVRGAFPGRRLVLAFQPHRYTRTRDCFEDFVRVLSSVDALLLAEVYPAGEAPIVAADGRALARAVRVVGKVEPVFVEQIADMPEAILSAARPGDVVVTMGAGSIGAVPAQLRKLQAAHGTRGDAGMSEFASRLIRSRLTLAVANGHGRTPSLPAAAPGRRAAARRAHAQAHQLAHRRGGAARVLPVRPAGPRALPAHAAGDRAGAVRRTGQQPAGARRRRARDDRVHPRGIEASGPVSAPMVPCWCMRRPVSRRRRCHALRRPTDCAERSFSAGIPGTVGGALAMNAGCYGSETWDIVHMVLTLTRAGELKRRTPAEFDVVVSSCCPEGGGMGRTQGRSLLTPHSSRRPSNSSPPPGSTLPRATAKSRGA